MTDKQELRVQRIEPNAASKGCPDITDRITLMGLDEKSRLTPLAKLTQLQKLARATKFYDEHCFYIT